MKKVILASASPRRRELLHQVGIEPEIVPSRVKEVITSADPAEAVRELSRQKAVDVAADFGGQDVLVIGADTVVAADGQILGKPQDRADAIRMLELLQGRSHQVHTGVTLVFCGGGQKPAAGGTLAAEPAIVTFAEKTDVYVYPMARAKIEAYVDTGEPMDKAGAYGIQGRFAAYVKGISGDYNHVVGLPVGRVCQELIRRQREDSEHEME